MLLSVVSDAATCHKVAVPCCVSISRDRSRSALPGKSFPVFQQMRPGLEPSGASQRQRVGWGGDLPMSRVALGRFTKACICCHQLGETVSGDLSQMQSLLIFPGLFGLVLALGTVHQAPILEEANNTDSYSLSLVWALHRASAVFRG